MNKENDNIAPYNMDSDKYCKSVSDGPVKGNNIINEIPIAANKQPVREVIPESRLSRFYGNFYYDEERESCFSADISINSSYVSKPLITEDDNDIGFWMLPEDLKVEEEECGVSGLSTSKQGRTIRELLLQLDSIYPELVLPHHLSNLAINIPFSFFACGNLEKEASGDDDSPRPRPRATSALYTPALQSDEEKILYEKVCGKDVKDCWKQKSCQLFNQGGKIQSFIRTPIFPLTPDLTSALERALQNFKIQMKNIYSTNDPFNKQKRSAPILSQSRKIIQSRHTHKPPRIQSAFKSNLLIKDINGRFGTLCIPVTSTTTRPKITADNPATINCCRQNQMTLTDITFPQKKCNKNTFQQNQKAPMIPAAMPGLLVNKSQQQQTIPVYQKPPETYAGRLSKNALSSSSNCVKHPTGNYGNAPNNNLILLTNSRKNNLKFSAKTRSLENIKISSQSRHQSVEIFHTPQNTYENNSKENLQNHPVSSEQSNSFKGVPGHHSKLTANSSFGSNYLLSTKKREPLSNERNKNIEVNSRIFANESNSLNSEKKNNYPSGYQRRKKRDSRVDGRVETNRMKNPIILLRKNSTSMKVSASPSQEVCAFKKSPELSSKSKTCNLSPQKGKSPKASLDCSSLSFNEVDTTPQSENSPKSKCCSSLVDNEINKQKGESNKDFDLLGNITGESTQDKGNRKKVLQGAAVSKIAPNPNALSGRRLYSAVLSSGPHPHIMTATSMSCDTFALTPTYTTNVSEHSLADKKSNRDLQLKSVYSVVSNQSLCSSEETVSLTDAHLEKLEREALEQYKVSDESLNENLEELERQAIEQYSGSSNSNTSFGVCNSQPKLKNKETNEKPKCCKSTNHIPKTIDSVVIYSKSASNSNTNVENSENSKKKSKNFKNVGMNKANKQKKKNSKFSL